MHRKLPAALLTVVAAATGIGGVTAAAMADGHHASAAASKATVKAAKSHYGRVIFDGKGRALYLFVADKGRKSTCYGACAKAWPPLLTKGGPKAGAGVRSRLLGTTKRRDGSLQVTYGGHPLYRFTGDKAPGQITCQNVSQFGAKWLVVNPAGAAVR